jgi:hypothetical protein
MLPYTAELEAFFAGSGGPVRTYVCFISGNLDRISVRCGGVLLREVRQECKANVPRTTEYVHIAVACILEVVGSYLDRNTSYSEVLRRSPESLQASSWFIPRLGQDRFLPNPFQFFIH